MMLFLLLLGTAVGGLIIKTFTIIKFLFINGCWPTWRLSQTNPREKPFLIPGHQWIPFRSSPAWEYTHPWSFWSSNGRISRTLASCQARNWSGSNLPILLQGPADNFLFLLSILPIFHHYLQGIGWQSGGLAEYIALDTVKSTFICLRLLLINHGFGIEVASDYQWLVVDVGATLEPLAVAWYRVK